MEQENILQRLEKIAAKFLATAETSSNTKTTLAALQVVEAAMKIANKLQAVPDVNLYPIMYLQSIAVRMRRSDLYQGYLDFCVDRGLSPIPKKPFLRLALNQGFRFHHMQGIVTAFPPGVNKLLGKSELKLISSSDVPD